MTEQHPNDIKTAAQAFPKEMSLPDAIALLNEVLSQMQRDGFNILSTTHLEDNIFMIEYK